MKSLGLLDSIQVLALKALDDPDWNAFYREVSRWYSRTFATPLHEVSSLPVVEVLTHYYETIFDDYSEDERKALLLELIETPEEKLAREGKEVKDITAQAAAAMAAVKSLQEKLGRVPKIEKKPEIKSRTPEEISRDMLGFESDIKNALDSAPAAPKPKVPGAMPEFSLKQLDFSISGDIGEDDALGLQSLHSNKPKSK